MDSVTKLSTDIQSPVQPYRVDFALGFLHTEDFLSKGNGTVRKQEGAQGPGCLHSGSCCFTHGGCRKLLRKVEGDSLGLIVQIL